MAAEAELGALYINVKEAIYIRQILEVMKHKQPCMPIITNNSTADGLIKSSIQPKRTKAMDMRLHWLHDREVQEQFFFYLTQEATTKEITGQDITQQHIIKASKVLC